MGLFSSDEIIDISIDLHAGMPTYPGDPEFKSRRLLDMERADPCNLTLMDVSAHAGTHVDAPCHFLRGGESVAELPLDLFAGRAEVFDVPDCSAITRAELDQLAIAAGMRVLLKTRNSRTRDFCRDFCALTADAAAFLAEKGVRAVGIDCLSIAAPSQTGIVHRTLLEAGIGIIESLDLSGVEPGSYTLVALPLKIAGADGSPVRAVLVKNRS